MSSYAALLRPFLPYIPLDLVSDDCMDGVLVVTQHLPAQLGINPFMFECSLDGRPVADFSVMALASRGDPMRLGSTDQPEWTTIRQFARSWADASSALSRTVEEVWLEFDVCLTGDRPSHTPSVFFSIGNQHFGVAEECLETLTGRSISSATRTTLAACFHPQPVSTRTVFLGAMLPRDPEVIRVVVPGMNLEGVLRYLERLGVGIPVEHLPLISDISNRIDELWLAIDISGAEVDARIGLDCYYRKTSGSENRSRWAGLLRFFVDSGICAGHKRDALLASTAMSNRESDRLVGPASLRRISNILGPNGFDRMRLHIHHVKVVAEPGLPLKAKAYLCGSYT